ncbi:MAG: hypothetical protein K6B72_04515 [Lachnospiraceae bacterium]|nr:hypothetical protein [Lachnospiraceae bacterium]
MDGQALLREIKSATISPEDAAEIIEMINRRRIISIVTECHANAILQRKDGRWYTSIGRGKKLISRSGESREDFLIRIYETCYAQQEASPTIDSIWPEFFEWYKAGRADDTWFDVLKSYETSIKGSKIASMPLKDITNADVYDFFDDLTAKSVGQHGAKYYGKRRTALNAVFRYASRKRLMLYTPDSADFSDYATRFKQRKPPETWSLSEYNTLLGSIDETDAYERCFYLQTLLGCRSGEMLTLKFSDVSHDYLDRPVIRIQSHRGRKFEIDPNGKIRKSYEDIDGTKGRRSCGIHDVPLSDEALRVIDLCRKLSTSDYLFERPDKPGEPLHIDTYNTNI